MIIFARLKFVNLFKKTFLKSLNVTKVFTLFVFVWIVVYFVVVSLNRDVTYRICLSFDILVTFVILLSTYWMKILVFIDLSKKRFEWTILRVITFVVDVSTRLVIDSVLCSLVLIVWLFNSVFTLISIITCRILVISCSFSSSSLSSISLELNCFSKKSSFSLKVLDSSSFSSSKSVSLNDLSR